MYNKIVLIGHLTKDPDLRYTPQGTPVATLRLAVNTKISADRQEALFIDTIVFGKIAESCSEYLSKGRLILIEGRLTERRWEHEGLQRSKFEVVANNVKFLPKTESKSQDYHSDKPAEDSIPEEITDLEPF